LSASNITVHWQHSASFFCEQSSQKTRESQREIMRMHDFCASRSVLLVTE